MERFKLESTNIIRGEKILDSDLRRLGIDVGNETFIYNEYVKACLEKRRFLRKEEWEVL